VYHTTVWGRRNRKLQPRVGPIIKPFPKLSGQNSGEKKTNIFSSNCLKEMNNDGLVIGVLLRQLQPTQSKNVSAVTPAN